MRNPVEKTGGEWQQQMAAPTQRFVDQIAHPIEVLPAQIRAR